MRGGLSHEAALFEREDELEEIERLCERCLEGRGGLLAVEGGPGIGKTSLLREAASAARDSGLRVLTSRCSELERDLPYGVGRQLFEPAWRRATPEQRERWTEGAARIGVRLLIDIPETGPGTGPEPSQAALHGLYWLASAMAEEQATLVVIDDLQWIDAPSLQALSYVARRVEDLPLAFLISLRRDEREDDQVVAALLGTATSGSVTPGPLSEGGVERAAEEALGEPLPPGCAEACLELTGGNPLLLRLLLDSIRGDDIDLTPDAIAAIGRLAPSSLARAVMLRLGRLPREATAIARAVAVLGDGAELAQVAALAELDHDATLQAASQLEATGIFSPEEALAFDHPLVRSGVYGDLSRHDRALFHSRAARILTGQTTPQQLAAHLVVTEPTGDPWVIETLRAAAAAAMAQGAAETAVTCLRRALDEPPAGDLRPAVLAELGLAEAAAGDEGSAEHLRSALEGALPAELRRQAAIALASALVVSDGTLAAVRLLEVERRRLEGDDALRLELEGTMLAVFEPDLAAEALARMKEFANLPGETPTERYALANACVPLGMLPDSTAEAAGDVALRALSDGELITDSEIPEIAGGTALYPLVFAERFADVDREAGHVMAHARTQGSALAFIVGSCIRCDALRARGELAAAAAEGELCLAQCELQPDAPAVLRTAGVTLCWVAEIAIARGEPDAARRIVDHWCEGRDLDDPQIALFHHARGIVAFHERDLEAARRSVEHAGAVAEQSGYEDRTTPWRLDLARILAALGDRQAADELVERQLDLARIWGTPGALGTALRVKALVGPREDASATLEEACALLERAGFNAQLAGARIDLGSALRRQRRRKEGRELLESGIDLAARCGARLDVERGTEELKVLGARPRRLAFSGVESLTASERRVAEMAADGMTNREIAQALFVTMKTVETHLSRTYRKLDISSREELPGLLTSAESHAPS